MDHKELIYQIWEIKRAESKEEDITTFPQKLFSTTLDKIKELQKKENQSLDEKKKIKDLVSMISFIYNKRLRKLIEMALCCSLGGVIIYDDEKLLEHEKGFFEELSQLLNKYNLKEKIN